MFTLAKFVEPYVWLALIYALLALHSSYALHSLYVESTRINTRKSFVIAITTVCILRCVSFISMSLLNYTVLIEVESNDHSTLNSEIASTNLDKLNLFLFNLPDFVCISAYTLLLVVNVEALLQSRIHWVASLGTRKIWFVCYGMFNVLLYSTQITLYILLFRDKSNSNVFGTFIYGTLTWINICIPIIAICSYFYLSILLSGFPWRSTEAKVRLSSLVQQGAVWTLARLGWGFIAWTYIINGWFQRVKTPFSYFIITICIFFFAEILPIIHSLQASILSNISTNKNGVKIYHYGSVDNSSIELGNELRPPPAVNMSTEKNTVNTVQSQSFLQHLRMMSLYPSTESLDSMDKEAVDDEEDDDTLNNSVISAYTANDGNESYKSAISTDDEGVKYNSDECSSDDSSFSQYDHTNRSKWSGGVAKWLGIN